MSRFNYLGQFIDEYNSILPAASQVSGITSELWFQFITPLFDDQVWSNFYRREVFSNAKFTGTNDELLAVIKKTIAIHWKSRNRIYNRMFNAYMADFNPLWNVDGVTGEIRESTHTGTDTDTHSGKDTTLTEDNGTIKKSGSEVDTIAGSKTNVRSGNEVTASSGTDTVSGSKTTYDSNTLYPTDEAQTDYGRSDTHTYNNVTDTESYANRSDTHQYNNVTDTHDLDGKNETTYASQLKKTLNLKDKDIAMTIRTGNIGVTRSDELVMHAQELFSSDLYDFVKYVMNDTLDQVSYAVY